MNAIVSLCHFCELHGPSVLFSTQTFHSHDPQHMFSSDNSLEDSGSYYSRDRQVRSPVESVSSSSEQTHPVQPSKSSDFCEVIYKCVLSFKNTLFWMIVLSLH